MVKHRGHILKTREETDEAMGWHATKRRFLESVKQQIDVLLMRKECAVAPGTSDLVNQWSRELGFPETESYRDSDVRAAVDRIYTYVNTRLFSSKPVVDPKAFNQGSWIA
jgi:hypothetical protein